MTATRVVLLHCDFMRCDQRYEGIGSVYFVRQAAREVKWDPAGNGHTADFCPDHNSKAKRDAILNALVPALPEGDSHVGA